MVDICEMRGVNKQYRGHVILDDMNLTVAEHEMVAITGRSGSGKTTVLNMLGLLEQPDSGQVRLFDRGGLRPQSAGANKLRRRHLGYLFQNFALIDNASVEQNLSIALSYVKGSRHAKQERIAQALSRVGLPHAESRKVYELSGGEQQRIAIARIMLKPCELILADEPTGSLDAENRDGVVELLAQMNSDGKTIILVTHDPEVARRCARVISLDDHSASVPEMAPISSHTQPPQGTHR